MGDRDEGYRGYGRPSGRYDEGRYYRGDGGRDDYRSDRGRDEDRGFFERAGEEIRSWFGDDDDRPRERGYGDRDQYRGAQRQDQDQDRGRGHGWGNMTARRDGPGRDDTQRREPWGGGDRGGRPGYGATSRQQSRPSDSHPHDDHYQEWRQQQLSELDRDYHEYRTENRDKFQSEFTNWRGQRQQQRTSVRQVKEHMEVVGSDGQPVGTVDKVAGDRIILTKNGPMAGGHHHSIPCGWLQSVDDKVTINKTAEDARKHWTDEENRRALFESEDQRRDDGPHILDRSFSGTYDR